MFIQPFLTAAQKYVINGTNFVLKPPAYCDLAILSKRFLLLFSYSGTAAAYLWRMFSHLEIAEEGAILFQHPLPLGLFFRSFQNLFLLNFCWGALSHCVALTDLKTTRQTRLAVLLPWPLICWEYYFWQLQTFFIFSGSELWLVFYFIIVNTFSSGFVLFLLMISESQGVGILSSLYRSALLDI